MTISYPAHQGMWINPDGSSRPARIKGGPLFDAFHGINRWKKEGSLTASKGDLARGYTSAVWAYRCIKLRADSVSGVPLILVDRQGAKIEEHPILTLLKDVNPYTMNLGDLLRATESAYNIFGVAYWLLTTAGSRQSTLGDFASQNSSRANERQPKHIYWLNPQTVEPILDSQRGVIGYRQTVGKATRDFAPEEVIAFRNFDPLNDLGGLSPLSVALNEVNSEMNATRFVSAFFENDARPAGLLSSDKAISDKQVEFVKGWWDKFFKGVANRWKTGIVGHGLRWQTISFPPRDLALRELREEDRRAICSVFGVPPGLAGAWESVTYATAREQKASFYEDTIIPQLNYMAEVLNWSLLSQYPDLTAKGAQLAWDIDSITALRESATDKAQRLTMLYEAGVITRNEVRAGLGIPALPEEEDGFAHTADSNVGTTLALSEATHHEKDYTDTTRRVPTESSAKDTDGEKAKSEENPLRSLQINEPTSVQLVDFQSNQLPGNKSLRDFSTHKQGRKISPSITERAKSESTLEADLKRWRRFALRRMKEGRAMRPFRSTAIPLDIWIPLNDSLEDAQSAAEIKGVFDAVFDSIS